MERGKSSPASPELASTGSGRDRGAGVPPAIFLPQGGALQIRARRLPHWEVESAIYFVTFRLADSLPKPALDEIFFRREDIMRTAAEAGRKTSAAEERELRSLHSRRLERALDRCSGACLLRNPAVAQAVADALRHFDGSRYLLYAWCVMPNHVHVLFQPVGTTVLADVLHSWKSYSAKAANRILRRRGELWQREYHDHLIRSLDAFERAERYIAANPQKAGLHDWRWVWSFR